MATRKQSKKTAQRKVESAGQDTVQILEPKTNDDADSLMGLHIPNPLHALFPDAKTNESGEKDETVTASLDATNLPSLPADETKSEATETKKKKSEKSSKRAKKSWFSRFMTALETPPDSQNEAPPAPPPIASDDEKPGAAVVRSIPALKSEQASEVPAQVETFEKPDQPKQIIEKAAALANAALSGIGKTPFQIPNLPSLSSSMFNTHSGSGTTGSDLHAL